MKSGGTNILPVDQFKAHVDHLHSTKFSLVNWLTTYYQPPILFSTSFLCKNVIPSIWHNPQTICGEPNHFYFLEYYPNKPQNLPCKVLHNPNFIYNCPSITGVGSFFRNSEAHDLRKLKDNNTPQLLLNGCSISHSHPLNGSYLLHPITFTFTNPQEAMNT